MKGHQQSSELTGRTVWLVATDVHGLREILQTSRRLIKLMSCLYSELVDVKTRTIYAHSSGFVYFLTQVSGDVGLNVTRSELKRALQLRQSDWRGRRLRGLRHMHSR